MSRENSAEQGRRGGVEEESGRKRGQASPLNSHHCYLSRSRAAVYALCGDGGFTGQTEAAGL